MPRFNSFLNKQVKRKYGSSSPVSSIPFGQIAYTTPGTYTWTVPTGVTSISMVCVGGGGRAGYVDSTRHHGGGGGALAYVNNYTVTPGQSLTIVTGAAGKFNADGGFSAVSIPSGTAICKAGGGSTPVMANVRLGGTVLVGLGGSGGTGGSSNTTIPRQGGGGGGAGGYTGAGGDGANFSETPTKGLDGQGGGGGGGGSRYTTGNAYGAGGGGGGVGILGEGSSGTGGASGTTGLKGRPGSGGIDPNPSVTYGTDGGLYGGGQGGGSSNSDADAPAGTGAVRIIWGTGRSFPSTNTADVAASWSVSNTNPVVAWLRPNTTTQQFFAIPSNGTGPSWSWSDGTNSYSINSAYFAIPGGVLFNGVTYNGYVRTTVGWGVGNPRYQISVTNTDFGTRSSNDITALNNLIYAGPYN